MRRFLASVTDDHHPWLRAFALTSKHGAVTLPTGDHVALCSVGHDIDDVVFPWVEAFRRYVITHEGFSPARCVTSPSYHFWQEWGFTSEDHFRDVLKRSVKAGTNVALPPFPGSAEAVAKIASAGHDIHWITARHSNDGQTERETIAWLDRHGLAYASMTCSRDKTVVPTDLYIDDRETNLDKLAEVGTLPVLMNAAHNQGIDRHLRVDSLHIWADIVDSFARWTAAR